MFGVLYLSCDICTYIGDYSKQIRLPLVAFFSENRYTKDVIHKVKVKQSRYRPGVAQRVPGSSSSQNS